MMTMTMSIVDDAF